MMLKPAWTVACVAAVIAVSASPTSVSAGQSASGANWTLRVIFPSGAQNFPYTGVSATLAMPAGSHWRCGVTTETADASGTTAEILCTVRSGETAAARAACSRSARPVVGSMTIAEPSGQETTLTLGCFFP
jgi:hypothetical protein